MLLKEQICNRFYFERVWLYLENSFFTVSTLQRCGGLQRTEFLTVSTLG